jgi:hypothetical protein
MGKIQGKSSPVRIENPRLKCKRRGSVTNRAADMGVNGYRDALDKLVSGPFNPGDARQMALMAILYDDCPECRAAMHRAAAAGVFLRPSPARLRPTRGFGEEIGVAGLRNCCRAPIFGAALGADLHAARRSNRQAA